MTDREKAEELSAKYFPAGSLHNTQELSQQVDCQNAILEMAEWKDKNFITKAREWFQLSSWMFAHCYDDEPSYDDFLALSSFLDYFGYKE